MLSAMYLHSATTNGASVPEPSRFARLEEEQSGDASLTYSAGVRGSEFGVSRSELGF
jgi:hypothetical protein